MMRGGVRQARMRKGLRSSDSLECQIDGCGRPPMPAYFGMPKHIRGICFDCNRWLKKLWGIRE